MPEAPVADGRGEETLGCAEVGCRSAGGTKYQQRQHPNVASSCSGSVPTALLAAAAGLPVAAHLHCVVAGRAPLACVSRRALPSAPPSPPVCCPPLALPLPPPCQRVPVAVRSRALLSWGALLGWLGRWPQEPGAAGIGHGKKRLALLLEPLAVLCASWGRRSAANGRSAAATSWLSWDAEAVTERAWSQQNQWHQNATASAVASVAPLRIRDCHRCSQLEVAADICPLPPCTSGGSSCDRRKEHKNRVANCTA
jgi:hypothetical protein